MNPTLLVLAAGMGSRYGGLKQMDKLGPSGETIIEYSIYDAIKAGFKKVVFVIRKDIEDDFKAIYHEKLSSKIKIEYAFQELSNLPSGFKAPEERTKPWGTSHAVLAAKDVIQDPFAVINADDFYGKDAYKVLHDFLVSLDSNNQNTYSMVGYLLSNTLSDHGYVSRGICTSNNDGYLESVVEKTHIEKKDGKIISITGNEIEEYTGNEVVSMNMWGFSPSYFKYTEEMFVDFLEKNITDLKSEFYIPTVANNLIAKNLIKLKVLQSTASWFGVTYQEDRPMVVEKINSLIQQGEYPDNLWK